METNNSVIKVEALVHAPVKKVWEYWTEPDHIKRWNTASDDWHTPYAENDLKVGGKFVSRMEAKDGSFGFDFAGIYDEVRAPEYISYSLEDGRKVNITFISEDNNTKVTEVFDPESSNTIDMQREGWQAILDNFKKYVEQK